jgi:hypothetical protein
MMRRKGRIVHQTRQGPAIQDAPGDGADPMARRHGKYGCSRSRFKHVADKLDRVHRAATHDLQQRVMLVVFCADREKSNFAFLLKISQSRALLRLKAPEIEPLMQVNMVDAFNL